MTDALEEQQGTVSIGGKTISKIRFADDIDGLAGKQEALASPVDRLDKTSAGNQCREDQTDDQLRKWDQH